jgi:hypothetical protein
MTSYGVKEVVKQITAAADEVATNELKHAAMTDRAVRSEAETVA